MGGGEHGERPQGAVSFLFTDIEGSSAWWDRDPTAMRAALELHDVLLRDVVARHGGHVFSSGGDAVVISKDTIGLIAVLVAECILLWFLLQRTNLGLKLRAVASNPDSARLHGIRAGTMLMLGWGLAAAIGALAGSLVASQRTGFDGSLMQIIIVYAFAAAALGGFDSLVGAVVAGLIVGIADALTVQYVDALEGIEVVVPLEGDSRLVTMPIRSSPRSSAGPEVVLMSCPFSLARM